MDPAKRRHSTRAARKPRSAPSTDITALCGIVRPVVPVGLVSALTGIRDQVAIAASAAAVCGAALAAQAADFDRDAALTLRRCVSDALAAQVEQLDQLIAQGAR